MNAQPKNKAAERNAAFAEQIAALDRQVIESKAAVYRAQSPRHSRNNSLVRRVGCCFAALHRRGFVMGVLQCIVWRIYRRAFQKKGA